MATTLFALAFAALAAGPQTAAPAAAGSQAVAPIPVRLERADGGWRLLRGGQPYFVQGVGGVQRLDELKALGGNSVRTWGVGENTRSELDQAHARGLSVAVGIWLGHKGHGFDYANAEQVQRQRQTVLDAVRRHKDHPAVLVWGLGNEMEIDNDNDTLWKEIGWLAREVKRLDPNHPVMTVVAEISPDKIRRINQHAPEIDILGINSYGGMATLPQRLREFGWTRPFIVTEFGPLGPWERPKSPWGAPHEPTSAEKADLYAANWERSVRQQPGFALGGYAFLWGDKQEVTPTWFGMFLPTGEKTEAVDVMSRAWTGRWPAQRAPRVERLEFGAHFQTVRPGAALTARVTATDPDGDALSYQWIVKREVEEMKYAGEGERRPDEVSKVPDGATHRFNAPRAPGAYRLYVTVRDGTGRAGTANSPFRVE